MWSTSLRDVTCCSHILGIPPHAKELMPQDSAYTLGMHPANIPQRGRPSHSARATLVGRELGEWPRMGIS